MQNPLSKFLLIFGNEVQFEKGKKILDDFPIEALLLYHILVHIVYFQNKHEVFCYKH